MRPRFLSGLQAILAFGISLSSLNVWAAVECSQANITLSSQAEVTSFQSNYGNGDDCDWVSGTLTISGADIVDLSGISALTHIKNLSLLDNPLLTNVDALTALTKVSSRLKIHDNPSLLDLDGLSGLQIAPYDELTVLNNESLLHIDGISGAITVSRIIGISNNQNLLNLDGLSGYSGIMWGSLWVTDNNSLLNLDGLSRLSRANSVSIQNNPEIVSLDGLSNFTRVEQSLQISGNTKLADISGLSGISYLGWSLSLDDTLVTNLDPLSNIAGPLNGSIIIRNNPNLQDLDGLSGIETDDMYSLWIINNPLLKSISALSGISGTLRGDLLIHDVPKLNHIGALFNISGVDGQVTILRNQQLTNVNGLHVIRHIGDGLTVKDNASLTQCNALQKLLDDVDDDSPGPGPGPSGVPDIGDLVLIGGNGSGCSSVGQILMDVAFDPSRIVCPSNQLIVSSQSQIDDFQKDFGPCHVFNGSVNVSGTGITSFAGFDDLKEISGQLRIRTNPALLQLDGYSSLTEIGGTLEIMDNDSLADITGLPVLEHVGGRLEITFNSELQNLDGLSSLARSIGGIRVTNNASLETIAGLSSISGFVGQITIRENEVLSGVPDFQQISQIGAGGISVMTNQSLAQIDWLPDASGVAGSLSIVANPSLNLFAGMGSIANIGSQLNIRSNHSLSSIDALGSLISVSNDVHLRDNSTLDGCESFGPLLDAIDHGLPGPGPGPSGIPDVGGSVYIEDNETGCNSVEEIVPTPNEASEPTIRITRSPNPLNLVADQPGGTDPTGTATITNTGDADSVLTGECSLTDADPQLTLMNGAFSVVQGAPGHVVTMSCDASAAGSFSATLSCAHNGTKALSPRTYPVKCVVNELADTETGPQVPCGNCANRTQRPLPASGPWADPEQDGSGFLFRIQDGTLAGFYFGYGDGGDSDWLLMNGELEPGDTPEVLWQLETHLSRYTGGSCPGCEYAAPGDIEQTDIIRVEFLQKNHARFRINGGAWHYLVPVTYGNAGYAYFPETTPYLFPEMAQADGAPAPWVYVINLVEFDGPDRMRSRLVHLKLSETIINQAGETTFQVRSVELNPPPGENPLFTIFCAVGPDAEASVCMVDALYDEYQWLFTMPFANLGANRFYADDELGNSIEGFRIGYD